MGQAMRGLAVVTGASSGIGFELARQAAGQGFDLIIAADEPQIEEAARQLRGLGARVEPVQADLASEAGVARLQEAIARSGQEVDLLCANAGLGLGHAFLDQEPAQWRRVIDTNITGTVMLIQRVGQAMRRRGRGRILITGSIAGFMPGSFQAVYNGSKSFLNSFSFALRNELKDSGVSVTCLMPGPTETRFFERADMLDTEVGQQEKDDPAEVARAGLEAALAGEGDVVSGWKNKVQTAMANLTPAEMLAEQHRKMAEPGSAKS